MDIFFQFGEYYNEGGESASCWQIFIEFIGATFGFGFALWLFYLQINKDRKKAEKQKLDSYRDLLLYYKELLISSINFFSRRLDDLDDYIERQEANIFNVEPLRLNVTNDFLRIKNIDNKGVFEAWTTLFSDANSIKQYKNNNAGTDFLEKHFVEIERMYNENSKHTYNQRSEVNNIIDHIPDTLAMMARRLRDSLGEVIKTNREYGIIQDYISNYSVLIQNRASLEEINQKFIHPLLVVYLENSTFYNSDEIIMLCKKARVKLNNIQEEQKQSIKKYKEIRLLTDAPLRELKLTIEKIDKLLNPS